MTTTEDARHAARRRRKAEVNQRIKSGDTDRGPCGILGCSGRTTAATGRGLNRRYCRPHEDQHERHGSHYRRSYTGPQVTPHRNAALYWLKGNAQNPAVVRAVRGVMALYASAGPQVEATRLRGLPPDERARAAWARLREAQADPMRTLAVWMAVERLAQSEGGERREFVQVQAAKIIHRMASGTHKTWATPGNVGRDGRQIVTEFHKYPNSRGRVLRHIGEQLERVAEHVAAEFLARPRRRTRRTPRDTTTDSGARAI